MISRCPLSFTSFHFHNSARERVCMHIFNCSTVHTINNRFPLLLRECFAQSLLYVSVIKGQLTMYRTCTYPLTPFLKRE